MIRIGVLQERIRSEYETYVRDWEEYEHLSQELVGEEDVRMLADADFSKLYARKAALMYCIEHRQELLDRLTGELDTLLNQQAEYTVQLKRTAPCRAQTAHSLASLAESVREEEKGPAIAALGEPVKPSLKPHVSTYTTNAYRGLYIISDEHPEAISPKDVDAFQRFLVEYNKRLQRERLLQQDLDKAIQAAASRRADAFKQLTDSLLKIRAEYSAKVQRITDKRNRQSLKRLGEIESFRERVANNIENGLQTHENPYEKYRAEDQQKLLDRYLAARKRQLQETKCAAEAFAVEMARRELDYNKRVMQNARDDRDKRREMAVDTKAEDCVRKTTGLQDPYVVLGQSTRPKHLRDPVSKVAQKVVPQAAGLGIRVGGKPLVDLTHFDEYRKEERAIMLQDTERVRLARAAEESQGIHSYLEKDPFYSILPEGVRKQEPEANPKVSTSPNIGRTPPSTKGTSRGAENEKGKGQKAPPPKEIDFDAWPSSDDDNDVALTYENIPPAPPVDTATPRSAHKQTLPTAKPVLPSILLEPIQSIEPGPACKLGTRLAGGTIRNSHEAIQLISKQTAKAAAHGLISRPLQELGYLAAQQVQLEATFTTSFTFYPPVILFYDYLPGKKHEAVVEVTNRSSGLAAFRVCEPEIEVLHLFEFTYTSRGAMSSGTTVPVKITFTAPPNEKDCLRLIDTFLRIRYQDGEVHVPIMCVPRSMTIFMSCAYEPVLKACQNEQRSRNVEKTEMKHHSIIPNKEGQILFTTLATAPHGHSKAQYVIGNSGALPAEATIQLDRVVIHSSDSPESERFRSRKITDQEVQDYLFRVSSLDGAESPLIRIYSDREIEERESEITKYDEKLAEEVEAYIASKLPPPEAPKKGKKDVPIEQPEPSEELKQEATTAVLEKLGPRPHSLVTEEMKNALRLISLEETQSADPECDSQPLLTIGVPTILSRQGNKFSEATLRKEMRITYLKQILAEKMDSVTTILTGERDAQAAKAEAPLEKKGGKTDATQNKKSSRPVSRKGEEPQPEGLDLTNPDVFKEELDRRVKEEVDAALAVWDDTFSVSTAYLEYRRTGMASVAFIIPPETIVAIPLVHAPLVFQTDLLFKMTGTFKPRFPTLDPEDPDYLELQSYGSFTSTFLMNAYTLPSVVHAVSDTVNFQVCFYGATYNAELRLRPNMNAGSRIVYVRIPRMMSKICAANITESIICTSTGDLPVRLKICCKDKKELVEIMNRVEEFRDKVDYNDLIDTQYLNPLHKARCPLESWAEIEIDVRDKYPPTLPSISLGRDIETRLGELQRLADELDSQKETLRELEEKRKELLERQTALTSGTVAPSAPTPGNKDGKKGRDTKTPAEDVQLITLELNKVSNQILKLNEHDIEETTNAIHNLNEELKHYTSIGGYVDCSFNVLIRVQDQPEPILVRIIVSFTTIDLDVLTPYTNPAIQSTRNVSTKMSQITKTARTRCTATARTKTKTSLYIVDDNLKLEQEVALNVGRVLQSHVSNIPLLVTNRSALAQHVALIPQTVPGMDIRTYPQNGVVLLFPGQEVMMYLSLCPQQARKFQFSVTIRSENGFIKRIPACATAVQPSLVCEGTGSLLEVSLHDVIKVSNVLLRSTLTRTYRWAVSPAFLTFFSTHFPGLVSVRPNAGKIEAQALQKISIRIQTNPALVLRLQTYFERLYDGADPLSHSQEEGVIFSDLHSDVTLYKNQFRFLERRYGESSMVTKKPSLPSEDGVEQPPSSFPSPSIDIFFCINIPFIAEEDSTPCMVHRIDVHIKDPLVLVKPYPPPSQDLQQVEPEETMPSKSPRKKQEKPPSKSVKTGSPAQKKDKNEPPPPVEEPPLVSAPLIDDGLFERAKESDEIKAILRREDFLYHELVLHMPTHIQVTFGEVTIGTEARKQVALVFRENVEPSERMACVFRVENVETIYAPIRMLSCLEGARLIPGQQLVLNFAFTPRESGDCEERIVIYSFRLATRERTNTITIVLRGKGVEEVRQGE
ncbi:hypothetical protein GMRT_15785 [Giardia muris]|uniref:Uncharacterized protein n=1 Tax=Giardia muris TaxID=5742 RepID=A0A4Z1STS5_GIAMU|nr:hypothetical protein GMRT_15785 [Giardia muris]|eukprot:TNJ29140.1 hypothetical protein GMRT_15785 [Giardia muris]